MKNEQAQSFDSVKTRLDEIVDAVAVPDISLDAALDLYEEAIKLGMQASNLLEEDISAEQILEYTVSSENTSEDSGDSSVEGLETTDTEATVEAESEIAASEDRLSDGDEVTSASDQSQID